MAKAEIFAGICGFTTIVEAVADGSKCNLNISSECKDVQSMAEELTQVQPYQEAFYQRSTPLTHQMAAKHCSHTSCPVPSGIIKAIEVEAGLALPADASIKISK